MVHGQAIGIPFRRRKGEQAPPPPKEVAWNPTIESNLPYKEVKYFKFVEGAGWQALNIGEILPVGQRVMIRIVTTEPYYEVSKAVSSQMTGIQIGKNGVSEYDIAGTLTGYSPQILTVTIGVDKNYVQWNPVIKSNASYDNIVFYYKNEKVENGTYLTVGSSIGMHIRLSSNPVNEIKSITVNGIPATFKYHDANNNIYQYDFNLTSKSPQNINITIDEYIRFEDIVQAYPLFFEFIDENGNLISWGGKAKVGSTITRTKGVAYANLLEGLYTVSNAKLNGNPLPSTAHVVERQMVFTCTATWTFDDNEPQVVLSAEKLQIPNSSLKILGHLPDISGHGNHGVFNNFEFAGMSGANGYVTNFKNWRYRPNNNSQKLLITDSSVSIKSELSDEWIIWNQADTQKFKIRIIGLPTGGAVRYRYFDADNVQHDLEFDSNGIWECPANTNAGSSSGFSMIGSKALYVGLTIEQIGEYEGAICFNGVNNFVTIPTLSSGGKQVLMKVNSRKSDCYLYDQRNNWVQYLGIVSTKDFIAYNYSNQRGKTYIDGILNENITANDLIGITHNITVTNNRDDVKQYSPCIGTSFARNSYAQMALYDFMLFDNISTEDKIKELNEYVGIAGGYVEKPEYYWDCFGKTNDDPDRDDITEQVSKDVANALSVKNADFKLDSGFGKYEVDFLDTSIWNSSNSTITSSKIDCKNAISHIMLLYYNVGGKEYPDIPSFKVIKTGADIDYSYIDETGSPKSVRIVDGVNVLPASHNTLYSGSGRFCGFGNPGIGNSVTITQIPEYQNGFVFNGKTAYLENLNILAITDFTAIAKRVWANKDNPMNECFIHKGVVSTPISESAFMLEYEITNDIYYRSASFGGYINVERVNRPENITYQTTESYNGIPIIKGSGIDTQGLVIGAVTNNYWKGIFYKLMLYSKTIDMLSINALKNLFALDILIDINHPIFKK